MEAAQNFSWRFREHFDPVGETYISMFRLLRLMWEMS